MFDAATQLSLLVLFVLCLVGVFYEGYNDNWMQRVGMCMVGAISVISADHIYDGFHMTFPQAAFVIGVTIYALGVAYKVWKFRAINKNGNHDPANPAKS